jgi:hypothetical protein
MHIDALTVATTGIGFVLTAIGMMTWKKYRKQVIAILMISGVVLVVAGVEAPVIPRLLAALHVTSPAPAVVMRGLGSAAGLINTNLVIVALIAGYFLARFKPGAVSTGFDFLLDLFRAFFQVLAFLYLWFLLWLLLVLSLFGCPPSEIVDLVMRTSTSAVAVVVYLLGHVATLLKSRLEVDSDIGPTPMPSPPVATAE